MGYYKRMKEYYERRAAEYDDAYLGTGAYSGHARPGFEEELAEVIALIEGLPPARVLDVGCGTGFITQHLKGEIVGLDQSAAMLRIAQGRAPDATFVRGDALSLPFPDGVVQVRKDVEAGLALSEALNKHPEVFSQLHVESHNYPIFNILWVLCDTRANS
jgi:SAM-dependent methyltransferase